MRYLITGGAGFIGSHLTDVLVARGDSVVALDDFSTGSALNLAGALRSGRVELIEGSTSNAGLVDSCMREVDCSVHLAGAVGMRLIMDDPLNSLLSNVRGADTVMAAAAQSGCRLIIASTSEVYGKLDADALHEDSGCLYGSPFKSRWSYAIAKSFAEAAAHGYVRAGADMSVVRFFNVVGERQTPAYGMVLPRFVEQALSGMPLTVYGDGTHTRSFTSIRDIVPGLVGVLDADGARGNVYNIGSSSPQRIVDLADRVLARTGSGSAISYVPYAEVYGGEYEEPACRVADTTALRQLTGWTVSRTLDEIIDEVVAYSKSAMQLDAASIQDGHAIAV